MTELDEKLDQFGPVDWMVVEFPGTEFGKGKVAPILADYVDKGLVRVLDVVFIRKDADGTIEPFEVSDLDESAAGTFRDFERDMAMVLSEPDVLDLADTMEPETSAVLLVWENLWAAPFGSAVRHAGGQLVASGRIPTQAVLAALESDQEDDEEVGD